jgi:hypothetical protein
MGKRRISNRSTSRQTQTEEKSGGDRQPEFSRAASRVILGSPATSDDGEGDIQHVTLGSPTTPTSREDAVGLPSPVESPSKLGFKVHVPSATHTRNLDGPSIRVNSAVEDDTCGLGASACHTGSVLRESDPIPPGINPPRPRKPLPRLRRPKPSRRPPVWAEVSLREGVWDMLKWSSRAVRSSVKPYHTIVPSNLACTCTAEWLSDIC